MIRLYHRLVARLCWWDNERLKEDISYTAKLIARIELDLRHATKQSRIAELQAALRNERAHLAGLDYCKRRNDEIATRAAMAARL